MTETPPPDNEDSRLAAPAPSRRLPDTLPGIDMGAFREMVRGNDDMIHKLLGKFLDAYGGKAAEIGADVAAGNFQRAIGDAHALKGVSGNIRATEVFEAAKALEAALKAAPEGPDIGPLLTDLAGALDKVMAGLSDALGHPPNPPA
ncbi:Hpt domain-containing protein [Thalassospiraceae bacterium LMO-SO8]|nr:Hpt domain-containing protein [Alphaproteobacteria bacterium LMO-S08]WND76742.1 Hpt domain-containing protein [Thalassospiraceae bacterium LMO-SO8]